MSDLEKENKSKNNMRSRWGEPTRAEGSSSSKKTESFGEVTDLSQVKESLSGKLSNETGDALIPPPVEKESVEKVSVKEESVAEESVEKIEVVADLPKEEFVEEDVPEKESAIDPAEQEPAVVKNDSQPNQELRAPKVAKEKTHPKANRRNNKNRQNNKTKKVILETDGSTESYVKKDHKKEVWSPSDSKKRSSRSSSYKSHRKPYNRRTKKKTDTLFAKLKRVFAALFPSNIDETDEVVETPQIESTKDNRSNNRNRRGRNQGSNRNRQRKNNRGGQKKRSKSE